MLLSVVVDGGCEDGGVESRPKHRPFVRSAVAELCALETLRLDEIVEERL